MYSPLGFDASNKRHFSFYALVVSLLRKITLLKTIDKKIGLENIVIHFVYIYLIT